MAYKHKIKIPDTCSIKNCNKTVHAKMLCSKHYCRNYRRGSPYKFKTFRGKTIDRFWHYVNKTNGCWLWTGHCDRCGYGVLYCDGSYERAHRYSYKIHKGKIPIGLVLDHLCRVPACVNPEHLEAVTNRENIIRGINPCAENIKKTHCKHGHKLAGFNLIKRKTKYGTKARACRICMYVGRDKYRARLRYEIELSYQKQEMMRLGE